MSCMHIIHTHIHKHPHTHTHTHTQVTMHKFISQFAWGPKMDPATQTAVYEAAKLSRSEIVCHFERWKADQRERTFSIKAAPTGPARKPVEITLTLDLDYARAGQQGSQSRQSFEHNVCNDLSYAAGVPLKQALKSPHIAGLFCPYSRSLLTLFWSAQAIQDQTDQSRKHNSRCGNLPRSVRHRPGAG